MTGEKAVLLWYALFVFPVAVYTLYTAYFGDKVSIFIICFVLAIHWCDYLYKKNGISKAFFEEVFKEK